MIDDAVIMFFNAVKSMQMDEGFQVPSPEAAEALDAASSLLEWSACDGNGVQLSDFCHSLTQSLRRCLSDEEEKLDVGKTWTRFFTFRTSKNFFILWSNFLTQTIRKGNPIFIQFTTHHIFKQLMKCNPAVSSWPASMSAEEALTYHEQNALRYATGYIPRNLMSKLEKSSHANKKALLLCLVDLVEEDSGICDESQDWFKAIDRGGLIAVTTNAYNFMYAMEVVVKSMLSKKIVPIDIRSELKTSIVHSDRVQYFWKELSAEWEPEESEILFTMITDLWLTMRGYAYASAFMEMYKQETKKTVQKSKGLRKKIAN